jgi:hypothetical protein
MFVDPFISIFVVKLRLFMDKCCHFQSDGHLPHNITHSDKESELVRNTFVDNYFIQKSIAVDDFFKCVHK